MGHALVVSKLQRLVESLGIIARVISENDRRLMREGLDEVHPAELGRIAARFARRNFNQAFDNERRLRTARAAIGVDWRSIGVDCVYLAIDVRNVILA